MSLNSGRQTFSQMVASLGGTVQPSHRGRKHRRKAERASGTGVAVKKTNKRPTEVK